MHNVFLVGTDHHNGLGLVRSFGIHGIKPYGIIIGEKANKGFLKYSKYWKQVWFANDEKQAIDILLKQTFFDKPVLIPYSDGVAQIIDLNLNELNKYYLCPSIQEKQGKIAQLMNKINQLELAKKIGLNMLCSEVVCLDRPKIKLSLPIIIKPIISAEGKKSDIRICHTQEDLINALNFYKEKNYKQALVQIYLSKCTEYVLTGALFNDTISFSIVEHIRQWPIGMGSGSFSKLCTESVVNEYAKSVLQSLLNLGYKGPIDIEFFKDKNDIFYLNEINWRSSGRNFVSLYNNVHSAYSYYCAITNTFNDTPLINTMEGYSMNEVTDFRHKLLGNLSLYQWNKDRRKTNNFSLWYSKDLKPTLIQYFKLLKKYLESLKKF